MSTEMQTHQDRVAEIKAKRDAGDMSIDIPAWQAVREMIENEKIMFDMTRFFSTPEEKVFEETLGSFDVDCGTAACIAGAAMANRKATANEWYSEVSRQLQRETDNWDAAYEAVHTAGGSVWDWEIQNPRPEFVDREAATAAALLGITYVEGRNVFFGNWFEDHPDLDPDLGNLDSITRDHALQYIDACIARNQVIFDSSWMGMGS